MTGTGRTLHRVMPDRPDPTPDTDADTDSATGTGADHDPARLFVAHRTNAILAWLGCAVLVGVALFDLWRGDLTWAGFVTFVAALAIVPGPFYRSWRTMAPWELVALVAAAVVWRTLTVDAELALFAATAVLLAVNLHLFTETRMSHRFIVALVAISTAAIAGAWAVVSWAADIYLGTSYIATNSELMWDLAAASIAGVVAGVAFDLYVRWWEARLDALMPTAAPRGGES